MKNPLKHGDCNVYERIQIHARQCKEERCSDPRYKELRLHIQYIREKQQVMYERRCKAAY